MALEEQPGVRHLLDLAADFRRRGGTVAALDPPAAGLPWPEQRDQIRVLVARLRQEMGLPEDGLPPGGDGASQRLRAISAAIDAIDSMNHGFVARVNGAIIGIAAATWPTEGLLELEWLGTLPGHRGAGAALIGAVLESWPFPTALRLRSAFQSHGYYLGIGFQAEGSDKLVLPAQRVAAVREGLRLQSPRTIHEDRGL